VEPTRLQKERKAKEQLAEKHISISWEKELEGVETYCQRREKMEGTRGQPMFLMDRQTLLLLLLLLLLLCEIQVLTASCMKMTAYWVIAPCSLVEVDRRFRSVYCLSHGDDRSVSTRLHYAAS
jgi:hypothetical protein